MVEFLIWQNLEGLGIVEEGIRCSAWKEMLRNNRLSKKTLNSYYPVFPSCGKGKQSTRQDWVMQLNKEHEFLHGEMAFSKTNQAVILSMRPSNEARKLAMISSKRSLE